MHRHSTCSVFGCYSSLSFRVFVAVRHFDIYTCICENYVKHCTSTLCLRAINDNHLSFAHCKNRLMHWGTQTIFYYIFFSFSALKLYFLRSCALCSVCVCVCEWVCGNVMCLQINFGNFSFRQCDSGAYSERVRRAVGRKQLWQTHGNGNHIAQSNEWMFSFCFIWQLKYQKMNTNQNEKKENLPKRA